MEKVQKLAQVISDKKGLNIVALDVRGVSSMTDFFLVAEGNVDRHVRALAQAVVDELDEKPRVEGLETPEWVVIDSWDVIIHILTPELRQRYQIERIWEEAKLVELDIFLAEGEES